MKKDLFSPSLARSPSETGPEKFPSIDVALQVSSNQNRYRELCHRPPASWNLILVFPEMGVLPLNTLNERTKNLPQGLIKNR